MDRDFAIDRFGSKIELGPCVVGRTIDSVAIRGFASLDILALISAPDIFDDEINQTGTQRELKKPHADASFRYATGPKKAGEANSRAFPEVILNVRDMQVVEITDWASSNGLFFDSHAADADIPQDAVKVTVDLDAIEFPKTTIGPEISRVDGNHRLDGPDRHLEEVGIGQKADDLPFPKVPFMLFLDLSIDEELKLFNDFNGKHEGMESSLLITQGVRLAADDLKNDPKRLPEWVGFQLTRRDRAFSEIAFVGGSKTGAKEAGKTLRVNLSAIRAAAASMIRNSHTLKETLQGQPEAVLTIINNYWDAVAETFPEAWADKKKYILLQSIGLNGFGEFGGNVVDRLSGRIEVGDFNEVLQSIRPKIALEREAYKGIAGAGGATKIAAILREAYTTETVIRSKILKAVGGDGPTPDDSIAALAEGSTGATNADSVSVTEPAATADPSQPE